MIRIQPQTVVSQLNDEINEFLTGVTHTDSYSKNEFARLISAATDLQGKGGDVLNGCGLRAFLYSGTGQFALAEKMYSNMEANHGYAEARAVRMNHFANHGFASEGIKLADDFFANRAGYTFVGIATLVMTVGGFNKVIEKLEQSQRNQEVLKMTETVIDTAKLSVEVLKQLNVSDAQVTAMLDIAGGILRANKLYWQGGMPDIQPVLAEQGGPALMYDYRIDVSPQESARLNWALTESLVDRELEIPGIHIGFVGTKLPMKLAA